MLRRDKWLPRFRYPHIVTPKDCYKRPDRCEIHSPTRIVDNKQYGRCRNSSSCPVGNSCPVRIELPHDRRRWDRDRKGPGKNTARRYWTEKWIDRRLLEDTLPNFVGFELAIVNVVGQWDLTKCGKLYIGKHIGSKSHYIAILCLWFSWHLGVVCQPEGGGCVIGR